MPRFVLKDSPKYETAIYDESSITIEQLELMAEQEEKIPERLSPPGRILYLGLFRLYALKKLNLIEDKEFETIRRRLLSDHDLNEFHYNSWLTWTDKIQKAERLVTQARMDKSYTSAIKALDFIYGLNSQI